MSFILLSEKLPYVYITLNRPEALNALNHEMILEITKLLEIYSTRNDIEVIIFRGAGDKAFCAGGDIKLVYNIGRNWLQSDRKKANPAWKFFADEYKLNALIHNYPKKVMSLCHGIVMGGGYGLAGNGSEVIVCETTRFAMPETAIGFFPDVGIGWKLSKAGALGMYIALTGNIFGSDIMLASGLATHYLPCKDFDNFNTVKLKTNADNIAINNYEEIETIFSLNSVQAILKELSKSKSDFARKTLDTLLIRSPLSLLVTFKHIKMAKLEDYEAAIARDYQLACAFFSDYDVYEGIRAQLVDKDKAPNWKYSSILNISKADIDYYFKFVDHI